MNKFLKSKLPGAFGFLTDFFNAMNNNKGGHSLRKWLAVGLFWLIFRITIVYTTPENLTAVLTILAGLLTGLVVTYTTGNIAMSRKKSDENPTNPPQEEQNVEKN